MNVKIITIENVDKCLNCSKSEYEDGILICKKEGRKVCEYGEEISAAIPKWCPYRKKRRVKRGKRNNSKV